MHVTNISWTVEKIRQLRQKIDPKPQYQRGPVWGTKDKQLLIDTILRGFDIPKIYLRKVDTHAYEYEVADGQQRLMAIWEFLEDEYAISEDCPVDGAAGQLYSELPRSLAKKVREFKLIAAVAYSASSSEIRELFIRLQRGMPLSQPEIRNAMPSQLGDVIRTMAATHAFFTSGPFPNNRYQTDDLVAHAFMIELTSGKRDLKAPELRKLYKDYEDGVEDSIVRQVMAILDIMQEMQKAIPNCISRKWGFVDVYWVLSALKNKGERIVAKEIAERYSTFESRRLLFVARPQRLLEGKAKKANRNLYNYIQAFKASGGLASNVAIRHRVLMEALFPQKKVEAHGKKK